MEESSWTERDWAMDYEPWPGPCPHVDSRNCASSAVQYEPGSSILRYSVHSSNRRDVPIVGEHIILKHIRYGANLENIFHYGKVIDIQNGFERGVPTSFEIYVWVELYD